MNKYNNKWFVIPKKAPEAKLSLICFPYAGGNPKIFFSWVESIPLNVELIIVQSPGRGSRMLEKPYSDMNSLISDLIKYAPLIINKPYVVFGHSLGSKIAFEFVNKCQQLNYLLPNHFIASASRSPHKKSNQKPIYDLPHSDFIRVIETLNGTPRFILENKGFMALFIPLLRADFEISETYYYDGDFRCNSKLTVIGGKNDIFSVEELLFWEELFTKDKKLIMIKGNHFFINNEKKLLSYHIRKIIEKTLEQL